MPNGAIPYLERAAAAEPGAAPIWFNLFQAFDLAGDLERGLASLDRALTIDPYYVPAILMKARGPGPARAAAGSAGAVPRDHRRRPERRQPARAGAPGARARARAGRADDERRAAALERPARRGRCRLSRRRFPPRRRLCRAADRPPQGLCAAAGQRPFPLSARDRILSPRSHFPWFAALEAKTAEIGRELLSLLAEGDRGFRPYVAFDPTQPVNQWARAQSLARAGAPGSSGRTA